MKNLAILAVIFYFQFSFAQRTTVKGTVTDQKNEPIPFASINVANSSLGTAANADGHFSLELPTGSYILTARSMGYRSNSLHITLSSEEVQTLRFVLVEKDEALQEVEVFGNRFERPDKIETLTRLPLKPYEQIQSISIISVPNQEPFNVEAYTLVNMQAAYLINPHWNVRLLANNLFDEIGYNAYRTSYMNQTDPRNFAGVLTYTF